MTQTCAFLSLCTKINYQQVVPFAMFIPTNAEQIIQIAGHFYTLAQTSAFEACCITGDSASGDN